MKKIKRFFSVTSMKLEAIPCHPVLKVGGLVLGRARHLAVQQGTFNWQASSYPDFIQNYFLLKRIFDVFDNRDKFNKWFL